VAPLAVRRGAAFDDHCDGIIGSTR
jgi:hypothetical protein